MYLIENILVSEEVLREEFVCNLSKCKGACCWEGDFGAPLDKSEITTISENIKGIKKHMEPEAIATIDEGGFYEESSELNKTVTRLMPDGACVFMTRDENNVAQCAVEIANQAGDSSIKKPISCHLYPLRITSNLQSGFEAINYDRWEICSEACKLGKSLSLPVFRFVKEAIIRKYGQKFYEKLEDIYVDRAS